MRTILLLLLLATPAFGQDLTNGKVFDVLADYSAAVAKLDSTDHAMVARGTCTSLYKNALNEKAIIWVKVKQGRDSYQGRAWETYKQRVAQVWRERISDKGNVEYRYKMGGANSSRYEHKMGEDDNEDSVLKKARFNSIFPLEFAIVPAARLQSGLPFYSRGSMVESLLEIEDLKATINKNGDLVADWTSEKAEDGRYGTVHIVFGKECDFLPVENRFDTVFANESILRRGQVNTEWEKINNVWLPKVMEAQLNDSSETVYKLNFRWKVGDALAKSTDLVDRKMDDWNKPVKELFDETWQVKGMFPTLFSKTKEQSK